MIEGRKAGGRFFRPLLLVLLLGPVPFSAMLPAAADAAPERWKAVAGNNGEERILYDPDSVVPSGPGRFRVRIMGFDKDHFPRKSMEEFDCGNRIVRDVEVVVERPDRPASRTVTPADWRDAASDSPRGELLKILCR
jgi:hypothetical protein